MRILEHNKYFTKLNGNLVPPGVREKVLNSFTDDDYTVRESRQPDCVTGVDYSKEHVVRGKEGFEKRKVKPYFDWRRVDREKFSDELLHEVADPILEGMKLDPPELSMGIFNTYLPLDPHRDSPYVYSSINIALAGDKHSPVYFYSLAKENNSKESNAEYYRYEGFVHDLVYETEVSYHNDIVILNTDELHSVTYFDEPRVLLRVYLGMTYDEISQHIEANLKDVVNAH
tara:strand:+ start:4446 stop:5132 length:687 start_codon:yes stop_codon:yes gene_type:complete